jgi:hypothetical protein
MVFAPKWKSARRVDKVIVQKSKNGEVNWIVETKGRVWEGTTYKDDAIREWCERISEEIGISWRYIRVDQKDFDSGKPTALSHLTDPESGQKRIICD